MSGYKSLDHGTNANCLSKLNFRLCTALLRSYIVFVIVIRFIIQMGIISHYHNKRKCYITVINRNFNNLLSGLINHLILLSFVTKY